MKEMKKKFGSIMPKEENLSTSIKRDFSQEVKDMKKGVEIGDIITYPKLCNFFNLQPATGKHKILQLEEMQRYIELEKSGRNFLVTQFYDVPIPKVRKNNQYSQYIEYILLDYFNTRGGYAFAYTKRQWYLIIGCINHNYIDYYRSSRKILQSFDFGNNKGLVKANNISEYFDVVDEVLRNIFRNALVSLKRKDILTYSEVYYIIDNNGDKRRATEEEGSEINTIKRSVLTEEFHLKSEDQLYYKRDEQNNKLITIFYKRVHDRYNELYDNKQSFFEALEILTVNNNKYFEQEMEYIKSQIDDIQKYRYLLNSIGLDKIITKTNKVYDGSAAEAAEFILLMNNPEGEEREELIEQCDSERIQREITTVLNEHLIKLEEQTNV